MTESNEIYFNEKGFSVYVQTDKGIYKPGQTGKTTVYIYMLFFKLEMASY